MGLLLLVCDQGTCIDSVPAGIESVLSHWRGPGRPRVEVTTLDRVAADPSVLDDIETAWLVLNRPTASDLFEVIGQFQDRQLPALLSRPNGTETLGQIHRDGIVTCPPGTEPEAACVVLQTLISQAPTLSALRREVGIHQIQQAGLCEQISKLDEELRMAAQLQQEFLPMELPEVGDATFHVLYRPAGYVSGDIYDVMRLDEHHVGFFVADAVGHGVPAALMTVYIKRSLRTKQINPTAPGGYEIISPSEALAKLNADMIAQQAGKVRFATACYGILDTRDNTLRMARAGHPFPMILHPDGEVETIEPEGGLLGVFADEHFDEAVVQLHPGDRLLLYSDGFECAFPDREPCPNGKRRVANENYAREFMDLGTGDPDEAFKRMESNLDLQAGSLNQKDDLTIVCLAIADTQSQRKANPRTKPSAA